MTQKQDWEDWVELNAPGNEPLKLREDTPEEIKKQFGEWKKEKAEHEAQGRYL